MFELIFLEDDYRWIKSYSFKSFQLAHLCGINYQNEEKSSKIRRFQIINNKTGSVTNFRLDKSNKWSKQE